MPWLLLSRSTPAEMLKVLYIVLFAAQVFGLVRCFRAGKGLGKLALCNLASVVLSGGLVWYYDTLPGYGIMPGFAYFPEVFASLCAAVAFFLLTLVTTLCWLLRKPK